MDAVVAGLGALLAFVFALSAIGKLTSSRSPERILEALRVEPFVSRARPVITAVAAAEIVIAAGLVWARGVWYLVFLACAWASMVAFLAISVRAARLGSRDECGCFGDILTSPVGASMTRRNVLLVVVSTVALAVTVCSLAIGGSPGILAGTADDVGAALVAVASVLCGLVLVGGASRSGPSVGAHDRPETTSGASGGVLLAFDGEVVDPVQRALRGRAQLLVFVRPGCASCHDLAAAAADAEFDNVDVRLVMAVGDGSEFPHGDDDLFGRASGLAHVDPAGLLARQLGVPNARPAAALVTVRGDVLPPFAEGREQVSALLAAVSAAESNVRRDVGDVRA